MNRRLITVFTAWMVLTQVSLALSAVREWQVDRNHSSIYFTADHIYSKVRGRFDDFSAQVRFDPANLKESRFAFSIEVKSIDTGIGKRDKHLLSPDFFDAARFPAITFVSRDISDKGGGLYELAGTLNVKDRASELVLPLRLMGIKEHPAEKDKQVAGFNGTIKVNLRSLQVGEEKFFAKGLIGPEVEVLVTLEMLSPL